MSYLEVFEYINRLTLIELNLLISHIEKSFNLTTSDLNNIEKSVGNNITSDISLINTEVDVIIESVAFDKKISLLKYIKNNFNLGLKESKEIIDTLPKLIKKCSTKEEAETLKKGLEDAGAVISLK